MARGGWLMLLLGFGILAAALGLGKLRFDPDILSMLPPEMPEVRGLKAFHDGFARQDELLLLIEGGEEDEGLLGEAAESLAAALEGSGTVRRARWRQQWEEQGGGLAELLAYLWLNGPEEIAAGQAGRLAGPRAEQALEEALAGVATAMEGEEMVMRANDPFGFLRHPSLAVFSAMAEDGADGFESPDGLAHLVLAEAANPLHGYREAGEYHAQVREIITRWQQDEGAGLSVRITGEPAFAAEIGGAMENDMRGTVGITALLIGLLFWIVQRRFSLLVGLGGVLGLVFITALGLAGWIFGELSIMAAGFAAILIGLTVDYGVLICQEAKLAGHDRRALFSSTGRSILWAAMTTAVVFLALNLSSLPGIAQLGTTVAVGIVAGALIMLGVYLPWVAKLGAGRETRRQPERGGALPAPAVAWLTVLLAAAASGVLVWQGVPGIEFDSRMMRPRHSEAMAAFDRVQAVFPQWDTGDLQLLIEAGSDDEMRDRLDTARSRTDALGERIGQAHFPDGWWPAAADQQRNQPALRALADDAPRLLALADQVGFSDEGVALGRAVLEELARLTREPSPVFPRSAEARDMMRMFVSRDEGGGGSLLARVTPADGADPAGEDYLAFRELSGDGIWLTGWSLLRPAVSPLVRQDLVRVFLPMAVLMIVMLSIIFRRPGDVGRILLAMALSGLVLLATMAGLGLGWNFLNIAATPLLLGTGIDYGIHVMIALRRNGGNVAAMWHGTGKAVLFCGCSTAIGFGSLCFASNDAMASLGTVAVIGILTSMLVSVFLLPGWAGRPRDPENGSETQKSVARGGARRHRLAETSLNKVIN